MKDFHELPREAQRILMDMLHERLERPQALIRQIYEGRIAHDAPLVERDTKRQTGTRKPRGSKMPVLDAWLDERLANNPDISNKELWRAVPSTRDDFERMGIYRDGSKFIEYRDDSEREITAAGFDKRVTAARKRR